jgi:hypothetical protein
MIGDKPTRAPVKGRAAEFAKALGRLRNYVSPLEGKTPEERAKLVSYDGPEVSGEIATRAQRWAAKCQNMMVEIERLSAAAADVVKHAEALAEQWADMDANAHEGDWKSFFVAVVAPALAGERQRLSDALLVIEVARQARDAIDEFVTEPCCGWGPLHKRLTDALAEYDRAAAMKITGQ